MELVFYRTKSFLPMYMFRDESSRQCIHIPEQEEQAKLQTVVDTCVNLETVTFCDVMPRLTSFGTAIHLNLIHVVSIPVLKKCLGLVITTKTTSIRHLSIPARVCGHLLTFPIQMDRLSMYIDRQCVNSSLAAMSGFLMLVSPLQLEMHDTRSRTRDGVQKKKKNKTKQEMNFPLLPRSLFRLHLDAPSNGATAIFPNKEFLELREIRLQGCHLLSFESLPPMLETLVFEVNDDDSDNYFSDEKKETDNLRMEKMKSTYEPLFRALRSCQLTDLSLAFVPSLDFSSLVPLLGEHASLSRLELDSSVFRPNHIYLYKSMPSLVHFHVSIDQKTLLESQNELGTWNNLQSLKIDIEEEQATKDSVMSFLKTMAAKNKTLSWFSITADEMRGCGFGRPVTEWVIANRFLQRVTLCIRHFDVSSGKLERVAYPWPEETQKVLKTREQAADRRLRFWINVSIVLAFLRAQPTHTFRFSIVALLPMIHETMGKPSSWFH